MFGNTSFGSNLFGNNSFGAFSSAPAPQPAAPVGTTIRFVPLAGTDSVQKTGSGGASQQSQVSTRHQNICAMKEYETKSAEELRLEDYQAGRKMGQPQTCALGGTPFGSSMFGMNKPATTTASSPFNVGSPFGANTSTATNQTSFPMFNKPAEPQTTSLFGAQPSTSSQSSPFSIFGNQPNQTQTSSVFGQTNTSSLFNSTMNKPATTSASSPFTSTTPFGTANTSMLNKPAMGPSLFGSSQTTTPQQGSIFGNPTPIAPFGANTSTANNSTNFSMFNKPAETQNSSPFGVQASTSSPFGVSIFGANKPATTTASSTFNFGSSFGANTSTASNQTGFPIFNKPAEPQQPTSLFGSQPSTSGQTGGFSIFGNQPNQTQNQNQTSSVFGQTNTSSLFNSSLNKPATTSASSPFTSTTPFGSTNTSMLNKPTSGPSLFGSNQTTTPQQGSLFGNITPMAPFGSNTGTSNNPTNSIFSKPADNQTATSAPFQIPTSSPFGSNLFGASKPTTTTANSTYNLGSSFGNNTSTAGSPLGLSLWQQTILSSPPAKISNHYKMNAKTTLKLNKPAAPKPMTNLVLFDELDERDSDELRCAIDVFVPKKTIKKLDLGSPRDSNDNSSRSASPLDNSVGSIVISTRPEYKLKPNLTEIEQHYNSEDDTCIIDSLLIERPNYGSIQFDGPLDVKGLNIDEIVHIRRKEVVVYPDDENKPPVDQGLNRPATVTLHQVWPFDKSTKQIITDVNRLRLMRYNEKVEATTIAEGAKFLEYRPETGSWVFRVEHFSKYSILDEYEEGPPPKEPQSDIETTSPPKLVAPNPLFDDFESDAMQATNISYVSRNSTKRLPLMNVSLNVSATVAPTDKQKINNLELRPDLYAAKNKLINDISSVCVSGSPRVRFFSGSRKLCYVKGDNVVVNELQLVHGSEGLAGRFGNLLQNSTIISMDTQEPLFAPYIETKDYITSASSHDLLRALYGIDLGSKTPYARQDERLNRAINWLASMNQNLSPPPDEDIYDQVIYLMSCNKYDQASSLALEHNHPRLALLVSTLNLNKDIIYEQLCSWRASNADQFIDPKLLKIYVLLAGLTEWRISNDTLVQSLDGLEWTQQLSLLATHATFATQPDNLLPFWIKRLETTTNDVDYHIMAKHSPQQILSAAESLSDEWFLLESLKSFKVIDSEVDCAHCDVIHCNLASQLVSIDLRWACFVALHITDNDVRKQILVRCLELSVAQLQSCENWLIESLKIPSELIELAKHPNK